MHDTGVPCCMTRSCEAEFQPLCSTVEHERAQGMARSCHSHATSDTAVVSLYFDCNQVQGAKCNSFIVAFFLCNFGS